MGVEQIAKGISNADIARFRVQADECRQHAERAINPLDQGIVAAAGRRMDEDGASRRTDASAERGRLS
jgi:hypothetical protein